jgi:hypothetical protein
MRATEGCRSDCSDLRSQSSTDDLVIEPWKPDQSRQQSIPYAKSRESFNTTQALQHLGRPLYSTGKWVSALVVVHQGIPLMVPW